MKFLWTLFSLFLHFILELDQSTHKVFRTLILKTYFYLKYPPMILYKQPCIGSEENLYHLHPKLSHSLILIWIGFCLIPLLSHQNPLSRVSSSFCQWLKIMFRSRTILADGTFCITPYLWYQTFVLNAEFRTHQFVPVAFGLLPDKKRQSYDDFFSLLKQALEHPSRDLELSAEWVMSDFEHNIRTSWQAIFPNIKSWKVYIWRIQLLGTILLAKIAIFGVLRYKIFLTFRALL